MVRRSLILLTLYLAMGSGPASACSCLWEGSFVEYANKAQGVIRARVISYGDKLQHGETLHDHMVVDVVAVLTGDFKHASLKLLGDPGHLCRDYVDSRVFVIGEEYLIALHGTEPVQPFGGCGEAWLAVNEDVVEGRELTSSGVRRYTLSMSELLEKLHRENEH